MGTVAGEPALEIGRPCARAARRSSSSASGGPGARPVGDARLAVEAERGGDLPRTGPRSPPPPGGDRPSARSRAGPAGGPSCASESREPAPARSRRDQRVALSEASGRRPCGSSVRAGHIAATNWSRCARRRDGVPLINSRRSGRNTLTSGRVRHVEQALDRGPVGPHLLGFARREADRQLMVPVLALGRHHDARRALAEAHHLALVGGAAGAARCSRSTAPRAGSSCRRRWGR